MQHELWWDFVERYIAAFTTRWDRNRTVRSRRRTNPWLCASLRHWSQPGSVPIPPLFSSSSGCLGPCSESGRGLRYRAPGGQPARLRSVSRSVRWSRSERSTGDTADVPGASGCPTAADRARVWSAVLAGTGPSLGIGRRVLAWATLR